MIKLLIGALLVSTVTLAQTAQKANQNKSTPGTIAKPTATSATRSTKPIPAPSLNANQQSGDNAIPTYRMAKDANRGRAVNRQFKPSRTASGARKDTMNQKRP